MPRRGGRARRTHASHHQGTGWAYSHAIVGCCPASGYDEFFSARQAARDAARYRRRGLDRAAQWIVDAVAARGVDDKSVLEAGGGIGAIPIELLKGGASHAVVVELSPGYDEIAQELAAEAGVSGRIERRHGDFVAEQAADADIVVLHRVVCCYPDYGRLLGAAARDARSTLVFTYPPRNVVSRFLLGATNLWLRLRGNAFRVFAHEPDAMVDVVRRAGFEAVASRRGGIWRGVAFARTR